MARRGGIAGRRPGRRVELCRTCQTGHPLARQCASSRPIRASAEGLLRTPQLGWSIAFCRSISSRREPGGGSGAAIRQAFTGRVAPSPVVPLSPLRILLDGRRRPGSKVGARGSAPEAEAAAIMTPTARVIFVLPAPPRISAWPSSAGAGLPPSSPARRCWRWRSCSSRSPSRRCSPAAISAWACARIAATAGSSRPSACSGCSPPICRPSPIGATSGPSTAMPFAGRRRPLRRRRRAAALAGRRARQPVQRAGRHPARAQSGHRRGLRRHPPSQLSGIARQRAGMGAGLPLRRGGCLLAALMIPPLLARIRAEEALLRTEFGAAYDAYRSHTSRLVPGLY